MKKLRKMKNQKGFTLVEVIVVLVILAIMAAILIPSLVGYIDKARENTIITEARQVYTAAQTLSSEAYQYKDVTISFGDDKDSSTIEDDKGKVTSVIIGENNILELSEQSGNITEMTIDDAKVTEFTYTSGDKQCEYSNGSYKVTDIE